MSPYDNGRIAAWAGRTLSQNPYLIGTTKYLEWEKGYEEQKVRRKDKVREMV